MLLSLFSRVTGVPNTGRAVVCWSRSCSSTPQQVYDELVKKKELSRDKHQQKVIEFFEELHKNVRSYQPPQPSSNGLSTFLFGSSKNKVQIPRGIYLWGTVGGGKTMLMDLFYDTVDEPMKKRVHYHDFMQDVHRLIHEAKKKAPPRDIKRWDVYQPYDPIPPVGDEIMNKLWLLCLDEFQVTDIADAMILKQLFAYLFDKGLVLVSTSNRPPEDLYKHGIQRSNFIPFIEMLKETSHVVSLDPGVDYRRKALGGSEKLYFVTTQGKSAAEQSMTSMFKFLAAKETDVVRPRTVRIKGRDVSFKKTCGQILDAEFDELCARPLWTNDYLKLTQVFHTIFIRNIPIMNMRTKSEARRFITLIDTLYDNKIRVVASGAAPYWELFQPEKISEQDRLEENRMMIDDLGIKASEQGSLDAGVFSGEEELFAFDRTVSRMTEMQTKDYWKKWKSHIANVPS